MKQPIIDPEKVNAWTASMRDAFAGAPVSPAVWVGVGVALGALVILFATRGLRLR